MIIGYFKRFNTLIKSILARNSLIKEFLSKNKFIRKLTFFLAGKNLKRISAKCKTVEEYINLAISYNYSLFKDLSFRVTLSLLQKKFEITKLMKIIAKIQPKVIFEIGTFQGGTLYLLSKLSNPDAVIISMDLPAYKAGQSYSPLRKPFYQTFALKNQKFYLIRKNSHKPSTLIVIEEILKNNKVDILFIDGDHSYDGIKRDFEMYSHLVSPEGIIIFHDIVPGDKTRYSGGVPIFWKEIRENYKTIEFVNDWNQKGFGIGVLFKNNKNF